MTDDYLSLVASEWIVRGCLDQARIQAEIVQEALSVPVTDGGRVLMSDAFAALMAAIFNLCDAVEALLDDQ